MSLLSIPIFKINKIIEKNKVEQIFVFFGNNLDIEGDDPNELFLREPNNKVFFDIFDQDELTNIQSNNIRVSFVKQVIYIDDTIGTIKLKVFEALEKTVSIDEMYLFCLKTEPINPITMYQNLTQNDKISLTKLRLEQMTTNIYGTDGTPIDFQIGNKKGKSRDKYTFDDILKLNLLERDYLVASSLGQKFIFSNEYPFIVDPFYVTDYDTLLEHSRKELSSLNNNLLLESGTISKNTIFLCLAQDVLNNNAVSPEYTSKIYYPFLHKANIDSIEDLDKAREHLIEDTSTKLSENVERMFSNIDMFYDIYK